MTFLSFSFVCFRWWQDNEYPTLDGSTRRINWGWAVVPPKSAQTLPREITFNVATHTLEQRPIDELVGLRASEVSHEPRVFVRLLGSDCLSWPDY